MDDPSPHTTGDDDDTYGEDRRTRLHRGRVVGFSVCIALWVLSAVPLARLSSDEGGGADVAAAYLVAGLGLAVVIRGVYALLNKRQFWSPWLFLIAAVLAILSYGVVSAGEEVASPGVEVVSAEAPERRAERHSVPAVLTMALGPRDEPTLVGVREHDE